MQVVSVINHKGGVGKTTLTANLGAGLAARGRRVLLIDLDAQGSLTLSFFTHDEWREQLLPERTIKHWFDHGTSGATGPNSLVDLVSSPPRTTARLGRGTGSLELIAAHHDLDEVDVALGSVALADRSRYAEVHGRLRAGLREPALAAYDVVLIDCAPHFGPTGRNAVAASDLMLIPTRPDYLSTNGIASLGHKVREFVAEFNDARSADIEPVDHPPASVVFTMVQSRDGRPIADQRQYMTQVPSATLPAFDHTIADSKSVYGPAPLHGVPVILAGTGRRQTRELRDVVSDLVERLTELDSPEPAAAEETAGGLSRPALRTGS